MPRNALYPAYIHGLAYLKAGQGPQAAVESQKVMDYPGITLLRIQGALARSCSGTYPSMGAIISVSESSGKL